MDGQFRKFCPEKEDCGGTCEECTKTGGDLGHEINVNYLASVGKECHCADCADR